MFKIAVLAPNIHNCGGAKPCGTFLISRDNNEVNVGF